MLRALSLRVLSIFILFLFLTIVAVAMQKSRAGSAALILSGQRTSGEEIENLQERLGEKESFFISFINAVKKIVFFDFGETIRSQPVIPMVWQSFRYTFVLAFWAAILALIYGLVFGISGKIYPLIQPAAAKFNYFLLSVPIFIIALLLVWFLSLSIPLFPPGGTGSRLWFVLPALALAIKSGARLALFTGEFIERESKKPYVRTSRAMGFSLRRIYSWLVLKNMLLPLLSFWLLEFGSYLAGAAIVETIFSIPGLGSLLLRALMQYDLNLILGALVFIAILIFLITLVHEILDKIYSKYASD